MRNRLPNRRAGIRVDIGTGPNRLTLTTGEYPDGRLGEIFLNVPKEGTFSQAMMTALDRLNLHIVFQLMFNPMHI